MREEIYLEVERGLAHSGRRLLRGCWLSLAMSWLLRRDLVGAVAEWVARMLVGDLDH